MSLSPLSFTSWFCKSVKLRQIRTTTPGLILNPSHLIHGTRVPLYEWRSNRGSSTLGPWTKLALSLGNVLSRVL